MMGMGFGVSNLLISVLTLVFGLLVLIYPKILNYVIGIYLCLMGIWGILGYLFMWRPSL
jgi:hypothetical protein